MRVFWAWLVLWCSLFTNGSIVEWGWEPELPERRVCALLHYLPELNSTLAFGGKTAETWTAELYLYNFTVNLWKKLHPSSDIAPSPRCVGAWASSSDRNSLYIHGGSGKFVSRETSELWQLDIYSLRWNLLDVGTVNGSQHNGVMFHWNSIDYFFVFTGADQEFAFSVFDLSSSTWLITNKGTVCPRSRKQLTVK